MTTFRVSEVESFRQWQVDADGDLGVLLARMRGQGGETEVMRAGTAFHKVLEDAPTGLEVETLEALGHTFSFSGDFEIALPVIREIRASKVYMVDGQPITISGQLDTIEGKRVEDHKTTGQFNPERYLDGYQWRLYLDIFEADLFRWNVFQIKQSKADPMAWSINAAHRLEQFRYPSMGADCLRLVTALARFARSQLPERFAQPIAA
jgi:hypothetical protein